MLEVPNKIVTDQRFLAALEVLAKREVYPKEADNLQVFFNKLDKVGLSVDKKKQELLLKYGGIPQQKGISFQDKDKEACFVKDYEAFLGETFKVNVIEIKSKKYPLVLVRFLYGLIKFI